jgi:hypothetical protein
MVTEYQPEKDSTEVPTKTYVEGISLVKTITICNKSRISNQTNTK